MYLPGRGGESASSPTMASPNSPPKKPRLSLQIKTAVSPARSSRGYPVDPRDPTTFNTLSNAYVTAIERSTPLTAINTLQALTLATPLDYRDPKLRVTTPYVASYPETPLSAGTQSPLPPMELTFPSAMTATPPLSAQPAENAGSKVFTFSVADTSEKASAQMVVSPAQTRPSPRRRVPPCQLAASSTLEPPYAHPRTLHSILRNSPLPPRTAIPPQSPRRVSLRLQEKALRKVEYHSPLTEDIITRKYTKSHVDLLLEEASPRSPASLPSGSDNGVDLAMAFAPNEIEDGGQTPGPCQDMRKKMAGFGPVMPSTPAGPSGVRKRKRKEKKRRWVWTIGQDEEEETEIGSKEQAQSHASLTKETVKIDERVRPSVTIAPVPSITYEEDTPTPSIESSEGFDIVMSETSSLASVDRGLTPSDMDMDAKTPTATWRPGSVQPKDDTPIPELYHKRDTPIPAELLGEKRDTPVPPHMR